MKQLIQNMKNIHGKKGEDWIASIPGMVVRLAHHWKLSDISEVETLTFHYVAKATNEFGKPVILKIGLDDKVIANEIRALNYFDGKGCVQLIDHHAAYQALLLQQAVPGVSLKSVYEKDIDYGMDCYIDTMKRLHDRQLIKTDEYRHIGDWLGAIDRASAYDVPIHLLNKAMLLKSELVKTQNNQMFLHGDLHHDNILQNDTEWLAIDPQGIVGEAEFEIAAFNFMTDDELKMGVDVKNIVEKRIHKVAKKSNLDQKRIQSWVFVRLMLMAVWQVEDNMNPSWALGMAESLQ